MKSLSVGEFKAHFSEVLEKVQHGESVGVLYGKSKKPVAKLVPMNDSKPRKKKRKLGIWEGKVKVKFAPNFKMTDEELLDLRG